MAVNATFIADFTSFDQAVKRAEVELADFAKGADRVGSTLNRMVDNFSGRKLVQEAALMTRAIEQAGGVSTLTASQLANAGSKAAEAAEKMRKLGIDVPVGLQRIADAGSPVPGLFSRITSAAGPMAAALGVSFSIGAVVQFGRSLLADADALVKLSDKTGISTTGLQKFQRAGDDAGNTLDEMTSAISQMQNRLAGDDKSALAALDKLGVSLAYLRSLTPDQQFIAISDALRRVEDPALQVNIAMDIFGRTGASVLPTLKRGFDDLKNASVGMSAETVKSLDEAGDALTRVWRDTKASVGNIVGSLLVFDQQITESMDRVIAHGKRDPIGLLRRYLYGQDLDAGAVLAEVERVRAALSSFMTDTTKMLGAGVSGLIPRALGMPQADEMGSFDLVKATERHLRALTAQKEATDRAAEATKRAETAYRAFRNEMGVLAMNAEAAARGVLKSRDAAQAFMKLPSGLLPSTEMMQSFMNSFASLPSGMHQVLEDTHTWHDTLNDVVGTLQVVGERWSTVATGILRNSQAIVALWQGGNRGAAVGTAIGAAGQLIPTDSKGGKIAFGATQGAAVGTAILPGIGTGVGAGIGAIVGWIQSQKAAKQVNDVRDAFVHLAGGLTALDARAHLAGVTLTAMLDAKNPKAYQDAIEALTNAIDFQDQSWQDLLDAVDRYGFAIDELGPALSQQMLDKTVSQLLKDFRLLEGAGVDVGEVSEHMADAINAYVHDAMKAGATVPLAMKEILKQLSLMGLLTDENGNLIGDLENSGIHFAETMTEQFSTLISKIEEMVDAIGRLLGLTNETAGAIASLPSLPSLTSLPESPGADYLNQNAFSAGTGGVTEIHTSVMLDGEAVGRSVESFQNDELRFRRNLRAA